MDQKLGITSEGFIRTGFSPDGFTIHTSPHIEHGKVLKAGCDLWMTPWNDLVWDRTWDNFLKSERNKAKNFLDALVMSTEMELGLLSF